jgi:signal transduction histidine kinase
MLSARVVFSIAAATLIAATLLLAFGTLDALELPLRDYVLRRLPERAAAHSIVVAIDEQSLRDLGPWPWERTRLAAIVDRIAASGARALIVDLLLPEPKPGDEQLAAAMRRIPTISVSVLDEHGQWLLPTPVLRAAVTPAHGNFELDHDGILRRLATTKQSRERSLAAISVEASSIVTGAPIPVGRSIAPMFRTRPREVPQMSASSASAIDTTALRGKLVFLGPTAFGLGDRVLTPVSTGHRADPGVTVHAAATESLIRGEEIHPLPPIVGGLLAGGAVATVLRSRARWVWISLATVFPAGGVLLLNATGIAVPFVTLLAAVVLSAAGVEGAELQSAVRSLATRLTERQRAEAESKRVLAHELKTPLASMRGLSQLLAGFDLTDAERRRVASLLEAEAGKLQSMVTALLDIERLPLRDFAAASAVTDLGALVAARVDFLRAGADRPLHVSADPNVFVRADPALIERVVDNLVGNAIKYTAAPVSVSVKNRGENAVLEVEDRGEGISEEERARIFDRFFRGSTARGTQGLGLGLTLVAEIARWHGGAVSLESAAGSGSRFQVVLPRAA